MALTYQHLVGDQEPYAETLRLLLALEWPRPPGHPLESITHLYTPHGAGGARPDYAHPRTHNDALAARSHGRLAVEIEEGETAVESETAVLTAGTTTMYVDAYGTEASAREARGIIDRIIADNQPNASRRLNKWDGTAAAIAAFGSNMPDWTHIPADEDADITAQYAGTLDVLWVAARTN